MSRNLRRYLVVVLGWGGVTVANVAPYIEALFLPLLGLSLVLLAGCGYFLTRHIQILRSEEVPRA
ncbi:hypothetical protein LCGC14_2382320 [marine sediment metagenome]|uniref:Uncharacterized protein n=1 Tax=marine sediment metagenome TaxID=412755 RepID=A0A0F9C0P7_9ZZZZ